MKIDRKALGKAVGICAMSWLAIPVIYYLLIRETKNKKRGKYITPSITFEEKSSMEEEVKEDK